MNEPARKRRWFRYSLRTLFVVMTVLLVCGGWVANQVHQRNQALQWIRAQPDLPGVKLMRVFRNPKPIPWTTPAAWISPVRSIPLDPRTVPEEKMKEIQRLFPEAEVYYVVFI